MWVGAGLESQKFHFKAQNFVQVVPEDQCEPFPPLQFWIFFLSHKSLQYTPMVPFKVSTTHHEYSRCLWVLIFFPLMQTIFFVCNFERKIICTPLFCVRGRCTKIPCLLQRSPQTCFTPGRFHSSRLRWYPHVNNFKRIYFLGQGHRCFLIAIFGVTPFPLLISDWSSLSPPHPIHSFPRMKYAD